MLSGDDLDFQAALAGQYSLERELGRGGMGIVYLAREVVLDRQVAIKRLPSSYTDDPIARERFIREARMAAQLFHPNIVPIHRVDSVGPHVFFVMGYVDGESAGDLVRRRGPLKPQQAIRILRDTALALGYGHARHVVHRDVKPDNLLIEKGSGRTLITDFGIAQLAGAAALTSDGQLLGSFHYMSPEQIAGEVPDGRSDVYALGAVGHYLLTGRPPFDAPTAAAVLAKHLNEAPPPIASRAAGIPLRLAAAIDRCLTKDRAARFATAEAFAEALDEVEKARAVPAPLRAWVTGAGGFDPGLLIVGFLTLVTIAAVGNFGLLVLPVIYAMGQRLRATRRLLAMGYDTTDLSTALLAEIDRRNEDAEQIEVKPSRFVKALRWIAVTSLGISVVNFAAMSYIMSTIDLSDDRSARWARLTGSTFMFTAMVTLGAGLVAEAISPSKILFRSGTMDLSWRWRFWNSGAGKLFARILRKGAKPVAVADSERRTEAIVGGAAASLFNALPKELRKELASLPNVVEQLEIKARDLRTKRAKMEELAIAAARPLRPASNDNQVERVRADTVEELDAARQRVDQQLANTIAALETIRLDLLRLHAGRGSTADLTAALNAAMAIGDEVSITLESRAAAERVTTA